MSSGPVRVLITDTNRWALSARLAVSLAGVGCEVSAVLPVPGHPMAAVSSVRRVFPYSSLYPTQSIADAIAAVQPDVVIPTCDRGVGHLHELCSYATSLGADKAGIAALIERSLGPVSGHAVVSSRYDLLALARREGIRVPETARVNTVEELNWWLGREPFPWILKADGTWGGGGVRVIRSRDGLERTLEQLVQKPRFGKALKRLVINRDPFWLRPWYQGTKHSVVAQSFVKGRPANCSAVAWEGSILAIICVEVVRSDGFTGPANIVRLVENDEIAAAARKIAARLNLSGFFGLDFMLEEGSGAPYLIEMNPRATPPCHLCLSSGRDLAAALWSQLSGNPLPAREPATRSELVAYFPQFAQGHQEIPSDCHRYVPSEEPDLVSELLHPFPDRTLVFRLFQRLAHNAAPVEQAEFINNAAR